MTRGSSASSDGTTSLTSPIAAASSAPTRRAMKINSFTRAAPISIVRRAKLAIESVFPSVRAIGKPNFSDGVQMRRSQAAAMPAPPPVQAPAMAAIVGTRTLSSAPSTRSIRSS